MKHQLSKFDRGMSVIAYSRMYKKTWVGKGVLNVVASIVFVISTAASAAPEYHDLHLPTARPGQPYNQLPNAQADLQATGTGPGFTVQLDRHHVIPNELLTRFYNTVIDRAEISRLSGFLTVFANNLAYYGGPGGAGASCTFRNEQDNHHTSVVLAGMANGGVVHNVVPGAPMEDLLDTFRQFFAYMPGNLFIGPTGAVRSDDPHSSFEENAGTIIGPNRLHQLQNIYNDMHTYLNSPPSSEEAQAALGRLSERLARVAARRSITQLNADDWVFENGRYHIKVQSLEGEHARNAREAEHEYAAANETNIDCILPEPFERQLVIDESLSRCLDNGVDGRGIIAWTIKGGDLPSDAMVHIATEDPAVAKLTIQAQVGSAPVSWQYNGWGSKELTFYYPVLSWAPAGMERIISNRPALKIIHDGKSCKVVELKT
ncbi:hypothetical protein AAHI06_18730 [Pseudomonas salmasensis]|uniref:hypothetical protein n=1 Tax=Pseudomonas salmasensis TaxID=2745514 RepID=UPI0032198BEB